MPEALAIAGLDSAAAERAFPGARSDPRGGPARRYRESGAGLGLLSPRGWFC